MFAKVAIPIPTEKTFCYAIPEALAGDASVGKRAVVPFGRRIQTGYIIELLCSADCGDTREIIEIPDAEPLFHEEDLRFYRWVADYYIYPLGKVLAEVLPTGSGGRMGRTAIGPRKERYIVLKANGEPGAGITTKQTSLLAFLRSQGSVSLARLRKEFGNVDSLIKPLAKKNIIAVVEREVFRSPAPTSDAGFHSSDFESTMSN